jgi:pimeloyl-ACP methyl ester carboxylesterase
MLPIPPEVAQAAFLDELPLMGSEKKLFQPDEIAEWMAPHHRPFFCLAVSLYSQPVQNQAGFRLLEKTPRLAVWKNDSNFYFVGCRGTAAMQTGFLQDVKDDQIIAGFNRVQSDISLVTEAEPYIKQIVRDVGPQKVAVGGHSLGGFAAMVLGARYQIQTVSWNGGAPPTKPVLVGPGPALATHYHIMGDLVSTHMGPKAAKVLRVNKGSTAFGVLWPHSTDRFLKNDPTVGLITATEEDEAYQKWAFNLPLSVALVTVYVAETSPIPGSARSEKPSRISLDAFYDVVKKEASDVGEGAINYLKKEATTQLNGVKEEAKTQLKKAGDGALQYVKKEAEGQLKKAGEGALSYLKKSLFG